MTTPTQLRSIDTIRTQPWPASRADRTLLANIERQLAEQSVVTTRCGRCGGSFAGALVEEREWFQTHECTRGAA